MKNNRSEYGVMASETTDTENSISDLDWLHGILWGIFNKFGEVTILKINILFIHKTIKIKDLKGFFEFIIGTES